MNSGRTTPRLARLFAPLLATLLIAATPAQAASVSYFLDQSNRLVDGPNYLQVTIADGLDGAIDFTVEVLEPLLNIAGSNFGIQSFYFNFGATDFDEAEITGLPHGWKKPRLNRRADGFGRFDVKLAGKGNARVDTLTFSIEGIDGDSVLTYASDLSYRRASQGQQLFAAHVAGFLSEACGNGYNSSKSKGKSGGWNGCTEVTSAFFGGSTAVPLPGAAWFLGTAFVAAALRARRRQSQ